MADALSVLMRWLHISSVVVLVGGVLFARLVAAPALQALEADLERRRAMAEAMAAHYKPLVCAAIAALVFSGIYNILTKPGHSLRHNLVLGVKLLLVAHVFAAALLAVQAHARNRARRMTGIAISGLIIIALSAYLRLVF